MEQLNNPEIPAHLLPISEAIIRYAMRQTPSYEEYKQELKNWWETHKEDWQEEDLGILFRHICLNSL